MAQQIKAAVPKPEELSMIDPQCPRGGRSKLTLKIFSDLYTCVLTCVLTHIHTQRENFKNTIKIK